MFAHTHTPHREDLERALLDAALAERVHAWVWITPPHGHHVHPLHHPLHHHGGGEKVGEKKELKVETLSKPIFFSDLARCMIKTFSLSTSYLGLWSTYFPDNLHISMGRAGSSAELRFNREYPSFVFILFNDDS